MQQDQQNVIWEHYQTDCAETFANSGFRLSYLVNLIESKSEKGDKVLNIGVGGAFFEDMGFKKGLDIFSLDPSAPTITSLQEKFPNKEKNFQVGYIQEIPFKENFFDFVVVSELLEHLPDDVIEKGLSEIHRVLKVDGCILGTVPANENLNQQMVICPNCRFKFHRWGHQQSFSTDRFSSFLKKNFMICLVKEKIFMEDTLNWKGRIHVYLKRILALLGGAGSGRNIIFLAKKTGFPRY